MKKRGRQKIGEERSDSFRTRRGVRQGCDESTLVQCIYG